METHKVNYILQFADNALILGHRLSEWCGHGPVLEQDIAITNLALDHLGQARNFYQYACELIKALPESERSQLFSAPALEQKSEYTEDDLAFLRDAWDFKNVLLVEQPNKDWAYTVARSFYYDHFNFLVYSTLLEDPATDDNLKAILDKSLKEIRYHKRWSSEWVIRLGDGTEESHLRIQTAVDDLWPYTGELFEPSDVEIALNQSAKENSDALKKRWIQEIQQIIEEATLQLPAPDTWMQSGGKKGVHSEHLGFILAEMQFLQRSYPEMQW